MGVCLSSYEGCKYTPRGQGCVAVGAFRPTLRGGLTSNNLERGEHAEMDIREREVVSV